MKDKLIKGLELINEAVREFEAEHGVGTCDITFETQKLPEIKESVDLPNDIQYRGGTRVIVYVDQQKWEK